MPFILIKNNLKLMLRSKWILILMIILPLITIALISSAFTEIMKTKYVVGDFKIGYSIEKDNAYFGQIPKLKALLQKSNIALQNYPIEEKSQLLKDNAVDVFVVVKEHSYQIYQETDKKRQAFITQGILSVFFYNLDTNKTLIDYAQQNNLSNERILNTLQDTKVKTKKLYPDPLPSSIDYYGIIYIAYFAWCGMVSLAAVISSERKSNITQRIQLSGLSEMKQYLGKFIPCTLAIVLEVLSAWGLSVLFLKVHWGNIISSAGILFLVALASSAFGMVLFQIFDNAAISIIVGFIIIWISGFFGGSFQTYIYAHLPQKIVDLSPIYYVNRTLVEYKTMGNSSYTFQCVAYLIGIITVCSAIGILLTNIRTKEQ